MQWKTSGTSQAVAATTEAPKRKASTRNAWYPQIVPPLNMISMSGHYVLRFGFFLTLLALMACGTGEDPTLLPEDTGPPPTHEGFEARAVEATQALNEGRWLDLYKFKSARSVQPRLPYGLPAAQLCTEEQFIFDVGKKIAQLRALVGLEGQEQLTWEITNVSSDERAGTVQLDIFHEGELVTDEFHDYLGEVDDGARWVYIKGEWWLEPEDWNKGCHQDRPLGI